MNNSHSPPNTTEPRNMKNKHIYSPPPQRPRRLPPLNYPREAPFKYRRAWDFDISSDFRNYYSSPSFLINLIKFFIDSSIDYKDFTIEDFFLYIIKNKLYSKNKFINENLNNFIELFFYKNINRSKKVSFKLKEYFYLKFSQIKKYNLDLETFFLEFEDKLLSE